MKKFLGCLAVSAFVPSLAMAQTVVTPDGMARDLMGVEEMDEFRVYMEAGESYCCTARSKDSQSNLGLSDTLRDTDGTMYTGEKRGAVSPRVTVNGVTDTDAEGNRVCYVPSGSRTYRYTVSSAKMGGEDVQVSCEKTTIKGSYNTNATPFNFLECTNRTNSTVTAKLYAENFDGERVIDGDDYTFTSGQRRDINIHQSAGQNKFGRVWLTHNSPRGGLNCNVSQYTQDSTQPTFTLKYEGTNPLSADAGGKCS